MVMDGLRRRLNEVGVRLVQTIVGGPRALSAVSGAIGWTLSRSSASRTAISRGVYSVGTIAGVGAALMLQAPLRHITTQWTGEVSSDGWTSPAASVRHSDSAASRSMLWADASPPQAPSRPCNAIA